ncbi:MAG: hypothetical protein JO146_04165 [Candidatus Eremiobacteraeota bacterium]|nr:hypothetical protein [Candidatus Eremiobacteraeota bacterium]
MTPQDLDRYVGLPVELELATGETLVGRLVADPDETAFGVPYVVKLSNDSSSSDVGEPTYVPVQGAHIVNSARSLKTPPIHRS